MYLFKWALVKQYVFTKYGILTVIDNLNTEDKNNWVINIV